MSTYLVAINNVLFTRNGKVVLEEEKIIIPKDNKTFDYKDINKMCFYKSDYRKFYSFGFNDFTFEVILNKEEDAEKIIKIFKEKKITIHKKASCFKRLKYYLKKKK